MRAVRKRRCSGLISDHFNRMTAASKDVLGRTDPRHCRAVARSGCRLPDPAASCCHPQAERISTTIARARRSAAAGHGVARPDESAAYTNRSIIWAGAGTTASSAVPAGNWPSILSKGPGGGFECSRYEHVEPLLNSYVQMMGLADLDRLQDELFSDSAARDLLDKDRHMSLMRSYIGFRVLRPDHVPGACSATTFRKSPKSWSTGSARRDATSLYTEGFDLKGKSLNTFGAFFNRGWREHDYLWGQAQCSRPAGQHRVVSRWRGHFAAAAGQSGTGTDLFGCS